jgi:hypothetical protein|tara:strand:+ start:1105 stop:1281 length:177 start_codon:yes stop_codon:yes gene_type:complete
MNIVSARYQTNMQGENISVAVDTGVSNLFVSVPIDNENLDYQAIQKWVAEGNTIAKAE